MVSQQILQLTERRERENCRDGWVGVGREKRRMKEVQAVSQAERWGASWGRAGQEVGGTEERGELGADK